MTGMDLIDLMDGIDLDKRPEGQTKRGSLLEAAVNVGAGYAINFAANMVVLPLFGWRITARENVVLGLVYTGISLGRSYVIRRVFNGRKRR